MSSTNKTQGPDSPSEQDAMETGIRRALGMPSLAGHAPVRPQVTRQAEHPGQGHQKRRFVQDGEVPVVMLRGRTEGKPRPLEAPTGLPSSRPPAPSDALGAQLRLEREGREAADRALLEANQALKDLRTRIGHASLALEEARETARLAGVERLAAEAALAAERETRLNAELEVSALQDRLAAALLRAEDVPAPRRPGRPPKVETEAAKPKRGRPARPKAAAKETPRRAREAAEPQPVKWWIKKKPSR